MFSQLDTLYQSFLNHFPAFLHPIISIGLFALLVIAVFQTLKKNFLWIILLIVLLPASVPVLKSIWNSILGVLQYLLGSH